MFYLKLCLFFLFIFSFWGCNKEEEIILDDTSENGAMVATMDGTEFKATKSVSVEIRPFDNGVFCFINGMQDVGNNKRNMQITLYDYKGVGTYQIGTPSENIAFHSNINTETNELIWSYRSDKDFIQNTGVGKLNIVSITSERIKGSFEFTGINSAGESKFIKGKFSIKL